MISRCTLVCVGKPKGWAAQGSEDYASRLRRYFHIDVIEVPEEDFNRRSREEVLSKENQRILKSIPTEAYVISLDRERGEQHPSEQLARKLEDLGVTGRSHVAFIIGGPLGLSPDVLQISQELWSLGEITLPHALARVVLLEQLYRAAKIHRNEKYHW
ncbi:MAG: 23S rRNA (pseudouridine(1915)-N(3))-methyltransferase RlmH [Rubrobacteraceae bacterium]|nr:23S rRNA (pseudouridine(1915)-N(3))-methyltransferase RlmH [Rubrobacteraceae bacterium]